MQYPVYRYKRYRLKGTVALVRSIAAASVAGLLLLCVGCLGWRKSSEVSADNSVAEAAELADPTAESLAESGAAESGEGKSGVEMPQDGFEWDSVAHLAAGSSAAAEALMQEAVVQRRKAAVDTAWRNPQLRGTFGWSDEDDKTPGRSGMRTYYGETDTPSRPFTNYDRHSTRDVDSRTLALRFYISNPFVNYWLKKRGESAARALEAESREVAYAVFCEVRSLCLEADILREELEHAEELIVLRSGVLEERRRQAEAGLITPLEQIRAEARVEAVRLEAARVRREHQRLLRRIAQLAGLESEGFRLKPGDGTIEFRKELLNTAELVELACLRRPDLERARYEVEEAERHMRVARYEMVPWVDFLEGRIGDARSTERSYRMDYTGHDRTRREESEWQIRAALSLPLFSWLGDEVRLSRSRQALALVRERGLLDDICREVEGALYDYCSAHEELVESRVESERLSSAMQEQLALFADEPMIRGDKVYETREEVLRYMRTLRRAEHECRRLALYLESVSGGPLN